MYNNNKIQWYFTGGIDYQPGPYEVLFDAGATNASFSIIIVNDNVSERNESFTLSIDHSSLPTYVSVADRGQPKVIILDDDCK